MSQTVHTHDERVTTGSALSGMSVVRAILTLVGAVALVIAVFQVWVNGANGDALAFDAYWKMHPVTDVNFWRSAALVPLGCAVLGVVGFDDPQRLDRPARRDDRDRGLRRDRDRARPRERDAARCDRTRAVVDARGGGRDADRLAGRAHHAVD